MDGGPPGSSVHGISQARILEWVAIPFLGKPSGYCTIRFRNVLFIFVCLFFIYSMYEEHYKSITVKYHPVDCVSWVPRLHLTYKQIGNMISE